MGPINKVYKVAFSHPNPPYTVIGLRNSERIMTSQAERLRICVFGSSSARTKPAYLEQARQLGRMIAEQGHVCVNGAGRFGGMGALNEGALKAGGESEARSIQFCFSFLFCKVEVTHGVNLRPYWTHARRRLVPLKVVS